MHRPRPLRVGLTALAVAAVAYTVSVGHASSLSAGSRSLGAKNSTVTACDSDGFTILPNLSSSNVASVTVGGIASACATAAISVTVNNGTTSSSGTGTVPAGGGSVTVTLAVAVPAKDSEQIDVAVSGP